jgi:gamma-glutamyltranspeptidase/glutathione hydrolase
MTVRPTAAVATPHPAAAAAGRDVLARGGNAVDAAVAAVLACCVATPGMVGLGGYGGSLVAILDGEAVAIDFDSRAPLAYRPDQYAGDRAKYEQGYLAITVPAVVAGLDLALARFGTLPWAAVSEPAIALAETGVTVTPDLKRTLDNWWKRADAVSRRALFSGGSVPDAGTVWVQGDLARLLRRLAADGPAGFYHGEVPRTIVRQIRDHGGILAEEDFARYQPGVVQPLAVDYRGHRVYTPPPPSGGLTSLQILRTLERFDLATMKPWSAEYFHAVAEAAKLAWRDRTTCVGDPDATPVPVDRLLSAETASRNAEMIRRGECVSGRSTAPNAHDSPHTVNVVAADAAGNVVSLTATQGYLYGSSVVIDGLGLVMNHGMSRFDPNPDSPNAAAPGKRMVHNMAPTVIVGRDGRAFGAVGLPGGPKIVTVTAQLVVNLIDFAASPATAVTAGRVHAEADEPVAVSSAVPEAVIEELRACGHTVRRGQDVGGPPDEIGGMANALLIGPGGVAAASQAGPDAAVEV